MEQTRSWRTKLAREELGQAQEQLWLCRQHFISFVCVSGVSM